MRRITRRQFIKYSAGGAALVAIPHDYESRDALAAKDGLNPGTLRKYDSRCRSPGMVLL